MANPIRLVALASPTLRAYPLVKEQTTVGSAPDNDVVIDHKSVSRRHAVIVRNFARVAVRDLESTNGTRINGRRVAGTARVVPGDELEFGSVRFAVMNSPRRRGGLSVGRAAAVVVVVVAAGFAAGRYVMTHWSAQGSSSSPSITPAPAAPPPAPAAAGAPEGALAPVPEANGEFPAASDGAHPLMPPRGGADWLSMLNRYRAEVGVPIVRENPALSVGDLAHARYLVTNAPSWSVARSAGAEVHNEEPDKPGYSVEGQRAGRAADIDQWYGLGSETHPPQGWAIEHWIASTWHRMALLNPRLSDVGYGEYCAKGACAAVLDVLHGLGRAGLTPAAAPAPVYFPPPGAIVYMNTLSDEWPDPLASCPGYALPAGLPITLQLGATVPARLQAYSLRRDSAGPILEACGFDSFTYANPRGGDQTNARGSLSELGAVAVIPRQPLAPGTYRVEMTVNGHLYSWRFSVDKNSG